MRAILTYHSIDSSESVISVSPETFMRHVEWLAMRRVRVTTVEELLLLPDDADAVALTFDDGFRNVGEIAAPLLASHQLPATVFIVADHVGRTNQWRGAGDPGIPTMPLLRWSDLDRLAGQGISVGAHTKTHPRLASLSGDALHEEILGSAQEIERRTGRKAAGFAYPYGDVSDAAASLVRTVFPWGCTTELHALRATDERSRLPRLDMFYFREPGRLESWGTARFNYYLTLRSHARRLRQRFTFGLAS